MIYLNGQKTQEIVLQNNAFLNGDAVKVHFFVKNNQLIMAEECYFFLMASMRKMRMNIPLSFTLEFFTETFNKAISENNLELKSFHLSCNYSTTEIMNYIIDKCFELESKTNDGFQPNHYNCQYSTLEMIK